MQANISLKFIRLLRVVITPSVTAERRIIPSTIIIRDNYIIMSLRRQFDLFTSSCWKYTLAVCCSSDVKADFLLVQHVQVLKDLKALQRHISSGHFEIMVQLAGLCVVIYLFSIASSSQSLNCTKDDYVQQILPCDSRTLTRSVVYYLNSSTW